MAKMMWRVMRALGFKNFSDIIKKFQAGGASLERTYRRTLGEKSFMYDLVREV